MKKQIAEFIRNNVAKLQAILVIQWFFGTIGIGIATTGDYRMAITVGAGPIFFMTGRVIGLVAWASLSKTIGLSRTALEGFADWLDDE